MNINRTKNSVNNFITGFIFKIIYMLMPFVIRTIIIYKLGMDYAGLSSLFTSILQVLSLSELGFSVAIAFAMYKPIVDDDKETICALLNFIRKIYYIIGVVLLVVGLLLMFFLPYLINGEYPADINIYVLYGIYLLNSVISYFFFAYKGVLFSAHQRNDIDNIIMTVCDMIMYILQIAVLLVFANYYLYIIFLPVSTLMINLTRGVISKKKYPQYNCRGSLAKHQKSAIYKNIGALAGHKLSGVVTGAITSIVVSAFLGLTQVAIYNNYYYLVNAGSAIISILYASITAGVGNSVVTESVEKNRRDFNALTFLNVWIVGFMAIALACLYQPFMVMWVGEEYLLPDYVMIMFALLFYFWKFKDINTCFKDACGMWRQDFWKPYIVILTNLAVNIALINVIGIAGTVIAIFVGAFLISFPWETRVIFREYFKTGKKQYYLRMLVYTVIVLPVGVLTYYVCSLLPTGGILWFLVRFAICCVLPNSLFLLFSFRTQEFGLVWSKVKALFARKRKSKENDGNGGEEKVNCDNNEKSE